MKQLDVLALAAHPDDTELCCSGTLAKLIRQGKSVGVADLTQGEMGTRGTPEERLREAQNAANILGLSVRDNLGLPDTLLANTREHQLAIIRAVRRYRPHVCLISAPFDRHPDHGNASRLMIDALFYGGLRKIETRDDNGQLQEPWRPAHILHYMQDRPFEPDFVFDISDTIDIKEKAILAFETQFYADEDDDGPQTYISSKEFFEGIKARGRHYGHLIGVKYGEPFKYYNGPVPLKSFGSFFESSPFR